MTEIRSPKSTPYCLQKPLLRPTSVRSSIVFQRPQRSFKKTKRHNLRSCCTIFAVTTLVTLLLTAIGIFVIFPLLFANVVSIQRHFIFPGRWSTSEVSERLSKDNFLDYGLQGSRNVYIDLRQQDSDNDGTNVTLGAWQILPLSEVSDAVENAETFSYDNALRFSPKPVLLYFHDSDRNRAGCLNPYRVLRRFFQIISFDYRGYGDSSDIAELSERVLTRDAVALFKWLKTTTNAAVYVWGHSFGGAVASAMIAESRREGLNPPAGLFLEAPFTSLKDTLSWNGDLKFFSWLPWFDSFILDPVEKSDLAFKTIEHVLNVNCPIMIVHSEDDPKIPSFLAEELYRTAGDMRDPKTQGTVRIHMFQSDLKLGHDHLCEALEMPDYIRQHLETCRNFSEKIPS